MNPLGAKGVGDSGTLPVAAALASAVEDAIGRPVRRVPLSPTRLHSLMTAADSRRAEAPGVASTRRRAER
jgi:CO/xanthine dehydrogenase Mo-binding subunit